MRILIIILPFYLSYFFCFLSIVLTTHYYLLIVFYILCKHFTTALDFSYRMGLFVSSFRFFFFLPHPQNSLGLHLLTFSIVGWVCVYKSDEKRDGLYLYLAERNKNQSCVSEQTRALLFNENISSSLSQLGTLMHLRWGAWWSWWLQFKPCKAIPKMISSCGATRRKGKSFWKVTHERYTHCTLCWERGNNES